MTLFDYDARPVTPQVVLIAERSSRAAYEIRDFLTRNSRPYEFIDVEDPAARAALRDAAAPDSPASPICILPDGRLLAAATVEGVAAGLGMIAAPQLDRYDLTIIGAGPAGLGAAVNASSEGLATAVVEGVAPGGQAGTTSLIENYLGFPTGISGSELATRAVAQAQRFGAEILLARRLIRLGAADGGFVAELSDATAIHSRAILMATGVEWRRLEVPGVEDLLGAGVYYGAGPSEAIACRGCAVVIVGAGNSAGQAAVRFSRYARQVTLLCRGPRLEASMSQYLIDSLTTIDNVAVRTSTHIAGVGAADGMRSVVLTTSGERSEIACDALFICIGGSPRSAGAADAGVATDAAGYVLTGGDVQTDGTAMTPWPLQRAPLPLETNIPGVFAAGDVRRGSIKRCAAAIGEGGMAVALVHRHLAGSADG
jgi:thioredoxin reductase (NADPH)